MSLRLANVLPHILDAVDLGSAGRVDSHRLASLYLILYLRHMRHRLTKVLVASRKDNIL